jgi:hypothetical protein
MLSVQGKSSDFPWSEKDSRAFFRGRDSRQERLDLAELVKQSLKKYLETCLAITA